MYQQHLTQSGLKPDEADVYEVLLKIGPNPARKIAQNTVYKRSTVYKILDDLVKLGLVGRKDEVGKVSVFEPAHPLKLKELAEAREQQAKNAQVALEGILGQMSSDFNLISGKPGVKFYEGLEGIKKVLEDTLSDNPQKQLLTFSDAAGYATYLLDWNTSYYAPKRKKLGIYEKVIIPNDPKALEWMKDYQPGGVTEILFIDQKLFPFSTEVNIYNNKVSFVTFSPKTHIGLIIQNKEIFDTLSSVFNAFWQLGQQAYQNLQPSWLKPLPPPQLV
ncbi:MAG: helix-turn-helix domain-containing protein [bacterium]|nr:helix-turn-helix domain-containing protein [bacterium]